MHLLVSELHRFQNARRNGEKDPVYFPQASTTGNYTDVAETVSYYHILILYEIRFSNIVG